MALYSQFSYGATDLELTTKRDRYPLFFRTVPTDFVFNEPRLRFIQLFGWTDEIGVIYEASQYYSRVSQYLNFVSLLCYFLSSPLHHRWPCLIMIGPVYKERGLPWQAGQPLLEGKGKPGFTRKISQVDRLILLAGTT